MAKKRMFFYKLTFNEEGRTLSNEEAKLLMLGIINSRSINNALSLDTEREKITMDEFLIDPAYLFARLGKKQDLTSLGKRNSNREIEPIIEGADSENWVDKLTYMIYNFDLGLFTVVKTPSAPGVSVIRSMLIQYAPTYDVGIEEIPNNEYYVKLFNPGSEINRISFKVPVPNVQFLESIPGVTPRQVENLMDMDIKYVEVTVTNEPRKFLTNDKDTIKDYILGVTESVDEFNKIEVTGKPSAANAHTFDLKDEYFGYSISVSTTRIEDREVVEKSLNEVKVEFRTKMLQVINENYDFLLGALS